MSWKMFAHEYDRPSGKVFVHVGSRSYVKCHLMSIPIIPVMVTEDADGRYYGWLENGKDDPRMIWPSLQQLDMCFPDGVNGAEKKGRGRVVRLSIEKREEEE